MVAARQIEERERAERVLNSAVTRQTRRKKLNLTLTGGWKRGFAFARLHDSVSSVLDEQN